MIRVECTKPVTYIRLGFQNFSCQKLSKNSCALEAPDKDHSRDLSSESMNCLELPDTVICVLEVIDGIEKH